MHTYDIFNCAGDMMSRCVNFLAEVVGHYLPAAVVNELLANRRILGIAVISLAIATFLSVVLSVFVCVFIFSLFFSSIL